LGKTAQIRVGFFISVLKQYDNNIFLFIKLATTPRDATDGKSPLRLHQRCLRNRWRAARSHWGKHKGESWCL